MDNVIINRMACPECAAHARRLRVAEEFIEYLIKTESSYTRYDWRCEKDFVECKGCKYSENLHDNCHITYMAEKALEEIRK